MEIKKKGKFKIMPYFSTGMLCTVFSKLKQTWCRAEMVKIEETKDVKVNLIDYGNDEIVPLDHITDRVFALDQPKLALSFSLANCVPFSSLTIGQTLTEMR